MLDSIERFVAIIIGGALLMIVGTPLVTTASAFALYFLSGEMPTWAYVAAGCGAFALSTYGVLRHVSRR